MGRAAVEATRAKASKIIELLVDAVARQPERPIRRAAVRPDSERQASLDDTCHWSFNFDWNEKLKIDGTCRNPGGRRGIRKLFRARSLLWEISSRGSLSNCSRHKWSICAAHP